MGSDEKYSTAVLETLGRLETPSSLHTILKLLHGHYPRLGIRRIDSRNTKATLLGLVEEGKVEIVKEDGRSFPLYTLKGNCNVRE